MGSQTDRVRGGDFIHVIFKGGRRGFKFQCQMYKYGKMPFLLYVLLISSNDLISEDRDSLWL